VYEFMDDIEGVSIAIMFASGAVFFLVKLA
jgi:hypothetical protein